MAKEFTHFPQLITELRLEIWCLALPQPLNRALYPYKKDPNGEDLYLRFDTSLIEPLHIELPLYSVDREARSVATKYVRKHKLVVSPDSAQSELKFARPFESSTDTIFLPTSDIDYFATELKERIHEPDLLNRNVSTPERILPRLAMTPSGFKSLTGDPLATFVDVAESIYTLYVVDVTCNGRFNFRDIEDANRYHLLELEGAPYAQLTWHSPRRQWGEVSGDGEVLIQLKNSLQASTILSRPGPILGFGLCIWLCLESVKLCSTNAAFESWRFSLRVQG